MDTTLTIISPEYSSCITKTVVFKNTALTNISLFPTPTPQHPIFYSKLLWIYFFKILLVNGIMNYLSFFDWLVSLTVMSSIFIHFVTNLQMRRFSFWRLNNIPLYIDIYTFYLDTDTYISITFSLVIHS